MKNQINIGKFLTKLTERNPVTSEAMLAVQKKLEERAAEILQKKLEEIATKIQYNVNEIRRVRKMEKQLLVDIKKLEEQADKLVAGKEDEDES